METLVLDFLKNYFDNDFCDGIQFSAVPKGGSGDLAVNFFRLTKTVGKSPVQIAGEVKTVLENADIIEKAEVSGPYLNLFFKSDNFFEKVLATPISAEMFNDKKIMIEYSSPNTNKPLHLGHMRNHALGLSLSKIFKKVGADLIQATIFNDRGVHICKSMLAYQQFGNGETPKSAGKKSDHLVGDYYVKFDQAAKEDSSLNDQAQKMLVDWEKGDPKVMKTWKLMNDWAYNGYETTYARQGLEFDAKYYESDLYKAGREFVLKGFEEGLLQKTEDGAVYIDLEPIGLDKKVLLRGNGTTVYMTQDIGTTVKKQEDYNIDQQIWIVADEQNYHFKVLFYTLEKLGLIPAEKMFHLGYGLVNLPNGRMKSREGTVVDADNLMDDLHAIAAEKIREHNTSFSEEEIYKTAEQIQNAAWKFYLLKTSPGKMITFDAEKSIDFQGATGPYLQYAGVRIKSIITKSGKDLDQITKNSSNFIFGNDEKILGVKILEFPKALKRAALDKNPTLIATYLLELSQSWAHFYAENSVLNAETEQIINSRLILAKKVLDVLESGLDCLGIEIPERM